MALLFSLMRGRSQPPHATITARPFSSVSRKSWIRGATALFFLHTFAGICAAAEDPNLPLAAAALVHRQDDQVRGCGVRVSGGRASLRARSLWVELSFNVYRSGDVLINAVAYELSPSESHGENRPERVAVQRAWIRPADAATARLGENAQPRDRLIYRVTSEEATRLFAAVAAAQPLMLGLRVFGQPRERLFEGIAAFSDTERERISTCLTVLAEGAQR